MKEALTTVLGVMLAALLAFWLDRRKRREENEFRLKQESLLRAVEAAQRFMSFFMSLPDGPLPQAGDSVPESAELPVAFARVHFFCSLKTIECSNRLNTLFNRAIMDVMKFKLSAGLLGEDVKVLDMQIASYEATNARIQRETELLLESNPNNPLVARYKEQSAEIFRLMAECCRKKSELAKQQYLFTEKCRDAVIQKMPELAEQFRALMLCTRDELKFKIDRQKYSQIIKQDAEENKLRLKDYLTAIRSQVSGKMDNEKSHD
jgi:flagellar biosynthesis GTPase FlhF